MKLAAKGLMRRIANEVTILGMEHIAVIFHVEELHNFLDCFYPLMTIDIVSLHSEPLLGTLLPVTGCPEKRRVYVSIHSARALNTYVSSATSSLFFR